MRAVRRAVRGGGLIGRGSTVEVSKVRYRQFL